MKNEKEFTKTEILQDCLNNVEDVKENLYQLRNEIVEVFEKNKIDEKGIKELIDDIIESNLNTRGDIAYLLEEDNDE